MVRAAALLLLLAGRCGAILLQLAANETRCLSESIPAGSMLTGHWHWVARREAEAEGDNSTLRQYVSVSAPAGPRKGGPPLFESTSISFAVKWRRRGSATRQWPITQMFTN